MCRPSGLVWAAAVLAVLAVTVTVQQSTATAIDCQRCSCGQQESVFSLHCQLTGTEDVVLDGHGPLDFSTRTLYMRVENASSLHLGAGFLGALRRYYSVAVDLWGIGNLSFAADFHPKRHFLFMGVGIVNCSLPELPQGVVSHSNAVGFRLSGSSVGVIRRSAFAHVSKVRYIELTDSRVESVEGPQIGQLVLSHRREVHHGSLGLLLQRCRLGAVQEGALSVHTVTDDEFVEISDTTISELGPGGLTVSGAGSLLVNHTVFRYLATGALDVSARGGISLLNSRVSAAAPAPLWRLRGGNGTRLDNVTFSQPPSASLVLLDGPTGEERLSRLRFGCSEVRPGWTAAAVAGRQTVADTLRRYLERVEAAAECDPSAGAAETGPGTGTGTGPRLAASQQAGASGGGGGVGMFGDPAQVGLELLILTVAAAAVAAIAAVGVVAVRRRRRWRPAEAIERRVLVEEPGDGEQGRD